MTVTGLTEVGDRLKELERAVARKIIKQGLRVGAKIMLAAARAEAPVETGLLRRTIKIRTSKGVKGAARLNVGTATKDYTGKAFYGSFIEYGHKVGKRRLFSSRKQVAPNPFLQRAFDLTKDQAEQTVGEKWVELIEEQAQG